MAWQSFHVLGELLKIVRAQESEDKAVPPTTRLEFLGTTVDMVNMTIEVSPKRLQELTVELRTWLERKTVTKRKLLSLIGKLSFVTNCVRAGRVILSRLIGELPHATETKAITVSVEMLKDIKWWLQFMEHYNGISLLWLQDCLQPNLWLATDACLTGGGGHCGTQYFHYKFNSEIMKETGHISQRELFTVVIAVKLWSEQLKGKILRVECDNEALVCTVNSGRTRDKFMLKCLRELAWVTATNNTWVKIVHKPGKLQIIPDLLSRWYTGSEPRRKFKQLTNNKWKRRSISIKQVVFNSSW